MAETLEKLRDIGLLQISEVIDPEAGYLQNHGIALACEVQECCPWFEFADLQVIPSKDPSAMHVQKYCSRSHVVLCGFGS